MFNAATWAKNRRSYTHTPTLTTAGPSETRAWSSTHPALIFATARRDDWAAVRSRSSAADSTCSKELSLACSTCSKALSLTCSTCSWELSLILRNHFTPYRCPDCFPKNANAPKIKAEQVDFIDTPTWFMFHPLYMPSLLSWKPIPFGEAVKSIITNYRIPVWAFRAGLPTGSPCCRQSVQPGPASSPRSPRPTSSCAPVCNDSLPRYL